VLIVVVAETCWGKLDRITLELLSDARKLSISLKGKLEIVLLCAPSQTAFLLSELKMHVRETIHLVEHEAFEEFSTETYLSGLEQTLQAIRPNSVFLGATANGRDVGPRLAARLHYAYFPHCLLVKSSAGGKLEITRVTHGGRVHVQASWPIADPAILTVKAGVADFPVAEKTPQLEPLLIRRGVSVTPGRTRLKKRIPADPRVLDIREAERLVAGGRGVGGKQDFDVLRSLADALGASLAASRAAVDLGWIEYERQVGQTGKSVSPRLYLAAGISGASHHLMGMRESEKIIAVNVDRQAPIFTVAHFGVLGDLHAVLPRLTEKIKQGKHSPGQDAKKVTSKV
jgi:electron transfer flavoprotein alpha subunit